MKSPLLQPRWRLLDAQIDWFIIPLASCPSNDEHLNFASRAIKLWRKCSLGRLIINHKILPISADFHKKSIYRRKCAVDPSYNFFHKTFASTCTVEKTFHPSHKCRKKRMLIGNKRILYFYLIWSIIHY